MARGTLIHRNPLTFRAPVSRDVDSLFGELWNAPLFRSVAAQEPAGFVPRIDAVETEHEYRVTAELPGLQEKDFEILLEDGVLTLKGEKHERTESEEGAKLRRVETTSGAFERRLRFDAPIDEDNVKANYEDGVLTVTLPKPAEARPQVRTITVETA